MGSSLAGRTAVAWGLGRPKFEAWPYFWLPV